MIRTEGQKKVCRNTETIFCDCCETFSFLYFFLLCLMNNKLFSILGIISRIDYSYSSSKRDTVSSATPASDSASSSAAQNCNWKHLKDSAPEQIGPVVVWWWDASTNHASSRSCRDSHGTQSNDCSCGVNFGSNWVKVFPVTSSSYWHQTSISKPRRFYSNGFNIKSECFKLWSRNNWDKSVSSNKRRHFGERWLVLQAIAILPWKRFCSKLCLSLL